jgi:hypothetical protein
MDEFSPTNFGPVLAALLCGDRCRALNAGSPDPLMRTKLKGVTLANAFAHAKVMDRDMALCCLAGLWLLHDFLDDSHTISQAVDTSSGSFLHGVMHRREGDFSNAKYWFRRVDSHEVLENLGPSVIELADNAASKSIADRLVPRGQFDPYAMVDACQSALRAGDDAEAFCRRVQQAEWEFLFAHCYRRAVAE